MSKDHEIGATVKLEAGGSLGLIVTCAVSGRYVPAKTYGEPENCHPAEYPEVELLSAVVEEREDAEGNVTNPTPPAPFDLDTLTEKERRELLEQVTPRALESESEANEPDYDDRDD